MSVNGESILSAVKEQPHIRTRIHPSKYVGEIAQLGSLKKFVEQSAVRHRGWDFPHLDRLNELELGNDRIVSYNNYRNVNEYWLFTQSLQFLHFYTIREILDPDIWHNRIVPTNSTILQQQGADGFLDLKNTIWNIAERIDFAGRMAAHFQDVGNWVIELDFIGIENFILLTDSRINIYVEGKCSSESLTWKRSISSSDLLSNQNEIVLKFCVHYLERLGYLSPNPNLITSILSELKKLK